MKILIFKFNFKKFIYNYIYKYQLIIFLLIKFLKYIHLFY